MSSLLPATEEEETGGIETHDSGFEDSKLAHGAGTAGFDAAERRMATNEPILIPIEETTKESTSLIDRIRDESRTDRRTSEKEVQDGEKSEKVQAQAGKQEAPETRHEGCLL